MILFRKQLNAVKAYRGVLTTEYPFLAVWKLSHDSIFSAFRETARTDTPETESMRGLLCSFLNQKQVPDLEEKADIVP